MSSVSFFLIQTYQQGVQRNTEVKRLRMCERFRGYVTSFQAFAVFENRTTFLIQLKENCKSAGNS